jgi:hypothetical protein
MKTEELISLLAKDVAPVPRNSVSRRFAIALAWGFPLAMAVMIIVYGLRKDLDQALLDWSLWLKLIFTGSLALAGFVATQRLSRPGVALGRVWLALAAPIVTLWLIAAAVLYSAAPSETSALIFGQTWKTCALNIALISVPLLAATLSCVRGLAPTRAALAGASAGLLAGALATLAYALHCPESAAPFVAIWYVLGLSLPAIAGALLGPSVLRW